MIVPKYAAIAKYAAVYVDWQFSFVKKVIAQRYEIFFIYVI